MFEKEKAQTGKEVNETLSRLEDRINSKKLNKSDTEKAIGQVTTGIVEAKSILDKTFDFNKAEPDTIANISNPWTAWDKNGIFKDPANKEMRIGLQGLLDDSGETSAAAKRYARQVWRTEMVSYLANKLQNSVRQDKGDIMEKIMGKQKVTEKEDEPMQALTNSMWLDPKLKDRNSRLAMAKEMTDSKSRGGVKDIPTLFEGYRVKELKVVTGSSFITIPLDLADKFIFKRMVFKKSENRIYGQMENGCGGNPIIGELTPPNRIGEPTQPNKPGEGVTGGVLPPKPNEGSTGGALPPKPNEGYTGGVLPPKPSEGSTGGALPPKPNEGSTGGVLPPKPNEGSTGGALPPKPSEGSTGGVLPPKPNEGSTGGVLPPKPNEGSTGGALPPKPNEGSTGGVLPPKPNEGSTGGVLPPKPNEGSTGGALPPKPSEGSTGGVLPPKPNEGSTGGALPPKPSEGSTGGALPPKPNEGSTGGTLPPKPSEGSTGGALPPKPSEGSTGWRSSS